jgi:hypothetical protein
VYSPLVLTPKERSGVGGRPIGIRFIGTAD